MLACDSHRKNNTVPADPGCSGVPGFPYSHIKLYIYYEQSWCVNNNLYNGNMTINYRCTIHQSKFTTEKMKLRSMYSLWCYMNWQIHWSVEQYFFTWRINKSHAFTWNKYFLANLRFELCIKYYDTIVPTIHVCDQLNLTKYNKLGKIHVACKYLLTFYSLWYSWVSDDFNLSSY